MRFNCSATSTVRFRRSSFICAATVDGYWASASSTRFVPTVVSGNLFENNPSTRPVLSFMVSRIYTPRVEQARGSSDSPVGRLQYWQRGPRIRHSAQIASAWTPGEIIPLLQRNSTWESWVGPETSCYGERTFATACSPVARLVSRPIGLAPHQIRCCGGRATIWGRISELLHARNRCQVRAPSGANPSVRTASRTH